MSTPTTQPQLSFESVIKAGEKQVSAEMVGEAVILDLESGRYYSLNPVGARVWDLIQTPQSVSAIRDVLLAEYEVERARCEQDLLRLLGDMAVQGLIEVTD